MSTLAAALEPQPATASRADPLRAQRRAVRRFSVSDGRIAAGIVEHDGKSYRAIDTNVAVIGTFRDLAAATRALPTVTSP